MFKRALQAIPFLLLLTPGIAQKKDLLVKKDKNELYLDHKVVAKESFFSIGRFYNLHPRVIASYNKLNLDKGLNIDQKIRVPLNDSNFTQQGNSGYPVYYKISETEDLSAVSSFSNASIENLRKWNNLPNEEVKKDEKLIIGFLLSKEAGSITINNTAPAMDPVVKTPEKTNPVVEEKPAVKEEVKKPEPVSLKEEEPKTLPGPGGYFKSSFDQQVKIKPISKNETVTSGIFKTNSGWQDWKYYMLIDNVPPGTIIRIINPSNNKSVYAKVLGEMSGIPQNEGLNIRISDAAASVLEIIEEDKFIIRVVY